MTDKQAEALRLSDISDAYRNYRSLWEKEAAAELRRLHARVAELEEELVQEAARTAEQKLRADQMSQQHDTQASLNRDARNQLAQLTAQLEAIGAGGVESLRGAKPLTDDQILSAFRGSVAVPSDYAWWVSDQRIEYGRAIERAHGIQETK